MPCCPRSSSGSKSSWPRPGSSSSIVPPVASWFDRRCLASSGDASLCDASHHEGLRPHPEERHLCRVSKDEATARPITSRRDRIALRIVAALCAQHVLQIAFGPVAQGIDGG